MHTLNGVINSPVVFLAKFGHPLWNAGCAHALAGGDIFIHQSCNLAPSCGLPDFKGSLIPAETPAHGKIEVAGIIGDFCQVNGAIMKQVAEYSP